MWIFQCSELPAVEDQGLAMYRIRVNLARFDA